MSNERAKVCLESAREALEHSEPFRVADILRELRSAEVPWVRAEAHCLEGDAAFALGHGALALSSYSAGVAEAMSPRARPALYGKVSARLAYAQAALGDPASAEATYREALSKLGRAPESADVLVAMASAANGLAFVLANAKDKKEEGKALAGRVIQHANRAIELLDQDAEPSKQRAKMLRARAHLARAFALYDSAQALQGLGELSIAAYYLSSIHRAEARLELRGARATRRQWESALATSKTAVPLACDFCARTEDAVAFLFPSYDGKAHLCGACALSERPEPTLDPGPCSMCGASFYRLALAVGGATACEVCLHAFAALQRGNERLSKACIRCNREDAPGITTRWVTLCDDCIDWALREIDRSSPREHGRKRGGEPTIHRGRRCSMCGLHRARAFVRVSQASEPAVDVCDSCIDSGEAITVERRPTAMLSSSTAAREIASADATRVDLARARVRWLEAAMESGRPELKAQLVIARTSLAEELYDAEELSESHDALQDAIDGLDDSKDNEMLHARFRVARLKAIVLTSDKEAMGRARSDAAEADRSGDLAHPERLFSWLADVSRTIAEPRESRRDRGRLLSIAARYPSAVSAKEIGRMLRLVGDCHYHLRNGLWAREAYMAALSVLEGLEGAELFAAPVWLGLGHVLTDPAEIERAYETARELFAPHADQRKQSALDLVNTLQALAAHREKSHAWSSAAATFDEMFDAATRADEQYGDFAAIAARAMGASARCLEAGGEHVAALEKTTRALGLLRHGDPKRPEISSLRKAIVAGRDGIDAESVCRFCDEPPGKDAAVVVGAEASICKECVGALADHIDAAREDGELGESREQPEACGFCASKQARAMLEGVDAQVCDHCIGICRGLVDAAHEESATGSPPRKLYYRGTLSCSFCAKSQREVKKLIANNRFYICDECIGLANDLVAEKYGDDRPAREALPKTPSSATCNFCDLSAARMMVAGPDCAICDSCVDLCNDIIAGEVEDAE